MFPLYGEEPIQLNSYYQYSIILFSEGLIIGRTFAFQDGLDLTIKTASTNSPRAYIQEGLLSEGYLRLRFGGLIFGRAFFFFGGGGGLLSEFYGITNQENQATRSDLIRTSYLQY